MLVRSNTPEVLCTDPSPKKSSSKAMNRNFKSISPVELISHQNASQMLLGQFNGIGSARGSSKQRMLSNGFSHSPDYFKSKHSKPQSTALGLSLSHKYAASSSKSPEKSHNLSKASIESPENRSLSSVQSQLRTLVGMGGIGKSISRTISGEQANMSHQTEEKSTSGIRDGDYIQKVDEDLMKNLSNGSLASQMKKAEKFLGKGIANKWAQRQNYGNALFKNDHLVESPKTKELVMGTAPKNQNLSQTAKKGIGVQGKNLTKGQLFFQQGSPRKVINGEMQNKKKTDTASKNEKREGSRVLEPETKTKTKEASHFLSNELGATSKSKVSGSKPAIADKKPNGGTAAVHQNLGTSAIHQRPITARLFYKEQTGIKNISPQDTNASRQPKTTNAFHQLKKAPIENNSALGTSSRNFQHQRSHEEPKLSVANQVSHRVKTSEERRDTSDSTTKDHTPLQNDSKLLSKSPIPLKHPQRDRNQLLYPQKDRKSENLSEFGRISGVKEAISLVLEDKEEKNSKKAQVEFTTRLRVLLDVFWKSFLSSESIETLLERLLEICNCVLSIQPGFGESLLSQHVNLFILVSFLMYEIKKKRKQVTNKTNSMINKSLEIIKRELHAEIGAKNESISVPIPVSLLLEQMFSVCSIDKELKDLLSLAESSKTDAFLLTTLQAFKNRGLVPDGFLSQLSSSQFLDLSILSSSNKILLPNKTTPENNKKEETAKNSEHKTVTQTHAKLAEFNLKKESHIHIQICQQKESTEQISNPSDQIHQGILPKIRPDRLYTLVLDLDETLIHYEERGDKGEFLIRPYAQEFIDELAKFYEITVFTASVKEYADWILDRLDSNQSITHRLYRHHTTTLEEGYTKDLSELGRDMSKILIVDNNPENFKLQPQNGVYIKSWYQDPKDKALFDLCPLLREIVAQKSSDVRVALNIFRDQMLDNIRKGAISPHANLNLRKDPRFQFCS